jgi:transcription antitermination protein NusB
MKSAYDPRHQRRRVVVRELFAQTFTPQAVTEETSKIIWDQKDELDKTISECAPAWPIDKLNRVDLAILRLAVYEMMTTDTPPKVIIDEAVELAKEFGSENSPSFINGVLGSALTKLSEDGQPQENQS